MAANGNDHLVIYGYSQGAVVANVEKTSSPNSIRREPQPPISTSCWAVTSMCPTAALMPGSRASTSRSSIGRSTAPSRPTPSSTRSIINRQYDGLADFPLYPLNLIADLNALLGFLYVHTYPFDVSLPPDPTTSPAYQGTHGDTSYYFFETEDLPLFGPLRTLGVPEPLIDVVEPFFRVLVELGYDRSIPPWEPTPARLIPHARPGDRDHRPRQRDRRGNHQRRGPRRLATAAEHSRAGHSCGTGHRNRKGGHLPAGDVN